MLRSFLRAKIHLATITGADPDYEGSIAICPALLERAGIAPNEQVDVYNRDNGERLTTYAIAGEPGEICLNGAAALKCRPGQRVIIACYCLLAPDEVASHAPRVVLAGPDNRPG
ncbi:MAG: aspartate 1-decarboxylase [Desulfovibrionaceae bacterium]|nr:aspartate 1-decarboxylase [Desulfovibrionaceae bacterium]MBF0515374.1 aspartate 1-decarboxylase [Desulfovibrionaceae bacterium]